MHRGIMGLRGILILLSTVNINTPITTFIIENINKNQIINKKQIQLDNNFSKYFRKICLIVKERKNKAYIEVIDDFVKKMLIAQKIRSRILLNFCQQLSFPLYLFYIFRRLISMRPKFISVSKKYRDHLYFFLNLRYSKSSRTLPREIQVSKTISNFLKSKLNAGFAV